MYRTLALAAVAFVTALFVGTTAIAQVETTPIPRPAKPNFSSMQFQLGTWNCTETNTRRASAYTSTLTNTMDPSGFWMNTKTVSHPTSWDGQTIAMDKTTYDAAHSRWVDVSTDDRGDYTISTSSGWSGATIVWHPVSITSVSSGNVVGSGDMTYTKVSDTKYTYAGSFKEAGGRTIKLKGTCTKG